MNIFYIYLQNYMHLSLNPSMLMASYPPAIGTLSSTTVMHLVKIIKFTSILVNILLKLIMEVMVDVLWMMMNPMIHLGTFEVKFEIVVHGWLIIMQPFSRVSMEFIMACY